MISAFDAAHKVNLDASIALEAMQRELPEGFTVRLEIQFSRASLQNEMRVVVSAGGKEWYAICQKESELVSRCIECRDRLMAELIA